MKKADELMLYTPEPKRPPLDARLCISVAEGLGQGRYIKGKTLTVAVWDNCKSPLVVWRFCGDYWTGELRREKNPGRRLLRPDYIDAGRGRSLLHTDGIAAMQEESELLQDYFGDRRPGHPPQWGDLPLRCALPLAGDHRAGGYGRHQDLRRRR